MQYGPKPPPPQSALEEIDGDNEGALAGNATGGAAHKERLTPLEFRRAAQRTLASAGRSRRAGNAAFTDGELKRAEQLYCEAMESLLGLLEVPVFKRRGACGFGDVAAKTHGLCHTTLSNLAAVALKQERWADAASLAEEAGIKHAGKCEGSASPGAVAKCWWRAATARHAMADYKSAALAVQAGLCAVPGDAALDALRCKVAAAEKRERVATKKRYGRLFETAVYAEHAERTQREAAAAERATARARRREIADETLRNAEVAVEALRDKERSAKRTGALTDGKLDRRDLNAGRSGTPVADSRATRADGNGHASDGVGEHVDPANASVMAQVERAMEKIEGWVVDETSASPEDVERWRNGVLADVLEPGVEKRRAQKEARVLDAVIHVNAKVKNNEELTEEDRRIVRDFRRSEIARLEAKLDSKDGLTEEESGQLRAGESKRIDPRLARVMSAVCVHGQAG